MVPHLHVQKLLYIATHILLSIKFKDVFNIMLRYV